MRKITRGYHGPLLPMPHDRCDIEKQLDDLFSDCKAGVCMDGLPLFTQRDDKSVNDADSKKSEIDRRLVEKPKACVSMRLDYLTRTMRKMDEFAEKIRNRQDYLEIKFEHPIKLNKGKRPYFEVLGVMVSNIISDVLPPGSLSMTNLRLQGLYDDKYWEFVYFIAKELAPVWREIPVPSIFYFEFKNMYGFKARDREELYTMKVGGAGSYRIVGMSARRLN